MLEKFFKWLGESNLKCGEIFCSHYKDNNYDCSQCYYNKRYNEKQIKN
jgi:hypothetical protein